MSHEDRLELQDALHFNHNGAFYDKVGLEFADDYTPVGEWDLDLLVESDPLVCKLDAEREFIRFLKEAGPEFSMNIDGAANNAFGQVVVL